jgi:hypothetical protein
VGFPAEIARGHDNGEIVKILKCGDVRQVMTDAAKMARSSIDLAKGH